MASATKTANNFSDTADSFRPSYQFDYHSKKGECQYKLLLENQVSQLSEFLQEGVPSKDKIEQLIRKFQKETDAIISQLLSETTQIRRKMRSQQDYYEAVVRQQKSKIRKLTEENIQLTSHLNTFEKSHSKVVQELKNGLYDFRSEASRQIQGLQLLLSQYQKTLQEKDKEIIQLKQECMQNGSLYEESKAYILNQARQIQQLREASSAMKQSLRTQQTMLRADQSKQLNLILDCDERYQQIIKKKEEEIYILAASGYSQRSQITDLLLVVDELKKDIQKERLQRVKSQERAKYNISKLVQNSQKSIKMIGEKYKSKIQKISDLLVKELKTAKKQIETLKAFIPKQIYSCLREIKGSLFAEVYQSKH